MTRSSAPHAINWPRRLRAQWLLAALLLAFGLGITVATAWIVSSKVEQRLTSIIGRRLQAHAELLGSTLDRLIYGRWREIITSANLDAAALLNGTNEQKSASLDRIRAGQPGYAWIGLMDANGVVLAATDNLLVGVDVSERPWFTAGLREAYVGDVHQAKMLAQHLTNGKADLLRFVDLAAPLRDSTGRVAGLLAAHLYASWADEVMGLLKQALDSVAPSAEIFVIDRDREIKLGPAALIGTKLDLPANWNRGWYLDDTRFVIGSAQSHGYRDFHGLGWTLIIRQPSAAALAPVAELRHGMLRWGLAASLLLSLAVVAASALLGRPVPALVRTVSALRSENAELTVQFEEAAAAAPGVIFTFKRSSDGRMSFPYAAASVKDLYGFAPEEIRNDAAPILARLHPDDAADVAASIEKSAQTLVPWRQDFRYAHPTKGEVWIEGHSRPVCQPDGSVVWHGFLHDVTVRKKSQVALEHLRRVEIAGQLAASASHDFHNLLTVISGNLQLAELRIADPETKTFVRTAIDAADVGARHNRRLLTLVSNRKLNPRPVDINARVRDVVPLLDRLLGKTIALRLELAPDLWVCHIDPAEIDSAILNLALNARDAIPNDGTIAFETSNESLSSEAAAAIGEQASAGDFVRLRVSDTGTGMSPDVLARAGEPLFTTKAHGKGTGLGLSSVMSFARYCGGFVAISSVLDRGTQVDIYLPKSTA